MTELEDRAAAIACDFVADDAEIGTAVHEIVALVNESVAAEREACASICEYAAKKCLSAIPHPEPFSCADDSCAEQRSMAKVCRIIARMMCERGGK